MKETLEKQVINYSIKAFPELLSLAMKGDMEAAGEIVARQEAAAAEIESLKIKAAGKARTPKAEKTPRELAEDNAYFRCALLVKQFGQESVTLQTLTAASALLDQGLAQGNLRQAYNRVSQVLKALAIEESVFPDWIVEAASEIPQLDENKKLEEEGEKVEEIKAVIQKYMNNEQTPATAAPQEPAAPSKKAGKK